jgi:hypothetical protein
MNCSPVYHGIGTAQNLSRSEDGRLEIILSNVCWSRSTFTEIIHFKSPVGDQPSRRSSLKF